MNGKNRNMHKWFIKYGNTLPCHNSVVYLRKKVAEQLFDEYATQYKYVWLCKHTYDNEHAIIVKIHEQYERRV